MPIQTSDGEVYKDRFDMYKNQINVNSKTIVPGDALDNLKDVTTLTEQMAPNGLNWDKWRQSTNIENDQAGTMKKPIDTTWWQGQDALDRFFGRIPDPSNNYAGSPLAKSVSDYVNSPEFKAQDVSAAKAEQERAALYQEALKKFIDEMNAQNPPPKPPSSLK